MNVQTIIDDAARTLGDPRMGRVTQTGWEGIYNDAVEYITLHFKVLEQDATHTILADESRYLYPPDLVQMKGWRYSATPSDKNTYQWASEFFEDEMRDRNWLQVVTGDSDFRYQARAQFFEITPQPTVSVAAGGLITYWKLAPQVADPLVDEFPLPDTLRRLTRDLMVAYARRNLERNDEWPMWLQVWEGEITRLYDRIEDRSDDRRSAIRAKSLKYPHRGMV